MHENTEAGMTRREAIRCGLLGAAGLSMAGTLMSRGAAPRLKATARSVIQIWMWGGPAHLDTFDPKPGAGRDYCGPYDKPIATNVDGIRIGQELTMLARQADKFSIIRSMTHGINAHETASYRVQTGHEPGRLVYPCAGAVVSRLKGYKHGYKGVVPPYIVLTQPQGRFSEAGFLGPEYKPFATGGDPAKTPFLVEGIVAQGMTDERQRSRRRLLQATDTLGKVAAGEDEFKAFDGAEDAAYEMLFGEARDVFDLSKETEKMRERYGMNTFGQSCLTARRLVERGVPYTTINYKGWDTHKMHFETMQRKLPEMDRGMATLLQDLADRGLLDSTIVWWGGEFGRSPKVQWKAPWNGGRSHFGHCFCSVVAGGGFKGGHVVGESNATGTDVVSRPVYPEDLLGSIYERMGIDPDGPLPNPRGMDLKVMPRSGKGEGRLKEIT